MIQRSREESRGYVGEHSCIPEVTQGRIEKHEQQNPLYPFEPLLSLDEPPFSGYRSGASEGQTVS